MVVFQTLWEAMVSVMMAPMNYKRPMLLIAVIYVLGVCVTARETGLCFNITAGAIASGIFFYGLITGKLNRDAAVLLFLVFVLSAARYHYAKSKIDVCRERIEAFKDMKVALTGVVDSHTSSKKNDKILINDAILSSAYGDAEHLPEAASDKMRARYNQKVGNIVVYITPDKVSDDNSRKTSEIILENSFHQEIWPPGRQHIACGDDGPFPGEIVRVYGKMMPVEEARNEGQFDFSLYYRTIGLSGAMLLDEVEIVGGEPEPFRGWLQSIRTEITERLDLVAEETDAGIYKALLVGDKSSMDEEIRDLYQDNGIAHILAVSGLHLAILGAGFHNVLRRFGATKKGAGICAAVVVMSYGILTGCSGSAIRAVIMLLIKFLGEAIGRTYDMLTAMAVAGMLLLFHEPYILFSSGFQLSFMAVFSLGLGAELPHPGNEILNGIFMSCMLQVMTFPVILYHFFRFPLYGIILNFLVLPLMSYVIYSGLLAVCLSFVSIIFGIAAIGFGHYILAFYTGLCDKISDVAYSSLLLGRPHAPNIICYYALLTGIILLILHLKKLRKRRMLPERLERLYQEMPKAAVIVFMLSAYILIPKTPAGLEITTIDVGQGDGFVIRNDGLVITIDGGSTSDKKFPENVLVPYLESQAIENIDMSFITHCDSDHYSGILYLLEENEDILIKELYLPLVAEDDERYNRMREAAEKRGTKISYFGFGHTIEAGQLKLIGLYPVDSGHIDEANSHSQGILLKYDEFRMLFTGDMDKECEYKMLRAMEESGWQDYRIDVLKAGHHGSSTSTSRELLEIMQPEYAVLSYGRNNDYGHPHAETIEALKEHGVEIVETGKEKEIRLVSDGKDYRITFPMK